MLTQPIGLQTVIGVSSKQKFKQELTKFGILYLGIIVYYWNAYVPLQKLTQELVYYILVL